jgi:hypothetical protein
VLANKLSVSKVTQNTLYATLTRTNFISGLNLVATAQCKEICPKRLNWPGRLAGISEGARSISKWKNLDHFSPSFLSQKLLFQELRV